MKYKEFIKPEDVEQAFYKAFEVYDIDSMMEVWSDSDDIACVHPMGELLQGQNNVKEGWTQVFSGKQKMHFEINHKQYSQDGQLAIHTVIENIYLVGDTKPRSPIIATNIYQNTDSGWKMILHHASPAVLNNAVSENKEKKAMH